MTEAIVVALIALVGTIVSVFVSAKGTRDKMTQELKIQDEVKNVRLAELSKSIEEVATKLDAKVESLQHVSELKFDNIKIDMDIIKMDIKEHNHYAKMFNENIPVIKERQEVANKRIADLEMDVKELRHHEEAKHS